MVDQINFEDITVDEAPATSAVLMGAAHHLGNASFVFLHGLFWMWKEGSGAIQCSLIWKEIWVSIKL